MTVNVVTHAQPALALVVGEDRTTTLCTITSGIVTAKVRRFTARDSEDLYVVEHEVWVDGIDESGSCGFAQIECSSAESLADLAAVAAEAARILRSFEGPAHG